MDIATVMAMVGLSTVIGVAFARAVIWLVLASLNQALLNTHAEPVVALSGAVYDEHRLQSAA